MTRREAALRRDVMDAVAFFAVRLDALRCAKCGSSDLVAVAPGEIEDRAPLFLIRAETPTRAWCSECWPVSFEGGVA